MLLDSFKCNIQVYSMQSCFLHRTIWIHSTPTISYYAHLCSSMIIYAPSVQHFGQGSSCCWSLLSAPHPSNLVLPTTGSNLRITVATGFPETGGPYLRTSLPSSVPSSCPGRKAASGQVVFWACPQGTCLSQLRSLRQQKATLETREWLHEWPWDEGNEQQWKMYELSVAEFLVFSGSTLMIPPNRELQLHKTVQNVSSFALLFWITCTWHGLATVAVTHSSLTTTALAGNSPNNQPS